MLSVNIGLTVTNIVLLGIFISIVSKYLRNKNSPEYIFSLKLVLFVLTIFLTGLNMGLNYGDLEEIKKEEGKSSKYKQQVGFGVANTILLIIATIFGIISIIDYFI